MATAATDYLEDLALARDRVAFARQFIDPEPWQDQALQFGGNRAIWNCARQSGKSVVAAIIALHRAIYSPGATVLMVSASARQSSELFKKARDYLRQLKNPSRLREDNLTSLVMASGSRILALPSSEETIRGFSSPSLIICDEASRIAEAAFQALTPMLAHGGELLLLSTPASQRGRFHEIWQSDDPAWQRLSVTGEQCGHIDPQFIEEELMTLGKDMFEKEYCCQFLHGVGNLFSDEALADMWLGADDSPVKRWLPPREELLVTS